MITARDKYQSTSSRVERDLQRTLDHVNRAIVNEYKHMSIAFKYTPQRDGYMMADDYHILDRVKHELQSRDFTVGLTVVLDDKEPTTMKEKLKRFLSEKRKDHAKITVHWSYHPEGFPTEKVAHIYQLLLGQINGHVLEEASEDNVFWDTWTATHSMVSELDSSDRVKELEYLADAFRSKGYVFKVVTEKTHAYVVDEIEVTRGEHQKMRIISQ